MKKYLTAFILTIACDANLGDVEFRSDPLAINLAGPDYDCDIDDVTCDLVCESPAGGGFECACSGSECACDSTSDFTLDHGDDVACDDLRRGGGHSYNCCKYAATAPYQCICYGAANECASKCGGVSAGTSAGSGG